MFRTNRDILTFAPGCLKVLLKQVEPLHKPPQSQCRRLRIRDRVQVMMPTIDEPPFHLGLQRKHRLLLERISLAGIARAMQVSEQWLQSHVNQKYASVAREVQVKSKKRETNHSM